MMLEPHAADREPTPQTEPTPPPAMTSWTYPQFLVMDVSSMCKGLQMMRSLCRLTLVMDLLRFSKYMDTI